MTRWHARLGQALVLCWCASWQMQAQAQPMPVGPVSMERRDELQAELQDEALRGLPAAYPRPASEWFGKERALYTQQLAGHTFDAVVLPTQVLGQGLDRSTRRLMTARLSAVLAQATGWKLPDPHIVTKAMGDGRRTWMPKRGVALAESLGAKRVAWLSVGHDESSNQMTVLISFIGKENDAPGAWSSLGVQQPLAPLSLPMAAQAAPIEVFESALPRILQMMGLKMPAGPTVSAALNRSDWPATPAGLIGQDDNPAQDAYTYLIYSALTPRYMEAQKEAFVEKAYLALARLSPRAPEYRALRARILLGLGSRPAALKALGQPRSPEEQGLQALANGHLPQLKAAADKESNALKRLLLKLDENEMATSYELRSEKQSQEVADALKLPDDAWSYLGRRAFVEWNAWSQFDNAVPKQLLERAYPVPGLVLQEMIMGRLALGESAKVQTLVDQSVFEHTRKLLEMNADKWCCVFTPGRPGEADYAALVQAVAHDNLIRRMNFLSGVQGRPEAALGFANSIDAMYRGIPYYPFRRAQVELAQSRRASADERESLHKSAYDNTWNAIYWEQGQSRISALAGGYLSTVERSDYGDSKNLYYQDRPFRPYYWTWAEGGDPEVIRRNMQLGLENATVQFSVARALYVMHQEESGGEAAGVAFLKSLQGRFEGTPEKNELLARIASEAGDQKTAMAYYRANVALMPGYWDSYLDLGKIAYQAGDA